MKKEAAVVVSGYSGDPDTRGDKTIKAVDLSQCNVGDQLYNIPDGQVMVPREFLIEYRELVEQSDFTEIHKLVRRTAVSVLLEDDSDGSV